MQDQVGQTTPEVTPVAAPSAVAIQPEVVPAPNKQRHFLAAFFYSYIFGIFGADRFYLGKIGTGMLKLLTGGGFFIWAMVDTSLIISGAMRDKNNQPLLEADRYRKLAKRTVAIVSWLGLLLIVATAAVLYYTLPAIGETFSTLKDLMSSANGLINVNPTSLTGQ